MMMMKPRGVHPCDMVPSCQVSRFPPLRYGAELSILAMSASTISMVSRCQVSRFQSPPDDALAAPLLRAERGRGCLRCNACRDDCVALVELILCKNVHFTL